MSNNIETIRHSLSHVLATAVLEMFPRAKLGIGPAIENGFYYDFDLSAEAHGKGEAPRTLIPEDLPKIENKMREIIAKDINFEKSNLDNNEAIEQFNNAGQEYKVELINDLNADGEKSVSIYKIGSFIDLCKGPHVETTNDLKDVGFKLDKIAGAYWKGSEKNKMLQRIYGLAFENKEELEKHLKQHEEAEKRDHRKLGRVLELFFFDESAPGMPYWLPKGLKIYNLLLDFWRKEHEKRGYLEIKSPLLNKKELYELSGHWEHYRENMFISKTEENETYGLKPMNCPNAMIVYKLRPRSYRELPLRYSDCDILHRYELAGTLAGLFRVREFSQDDAHIFVSEDQIKDEYKNIFEIVEKFYSVFDLDYSFRLGTRPEKFMGDEKVWDQAEDILKEILKESGKEHTIKEGDGAFYGPKIDILMKDSLGREWQMGTIQLDFQLPQKFCLKYIDEKGHETTPAVIHRVIYGSIERFIGILIEHYAGAFPTWLAPVQAIVLPISDKHLDYAKKIMQELKDNDIRVEIDERNESIGKKIREAEMQKIPYMLIVGDKEIDAKKVAIRKYGEGDKGQISLTDLVKDIRSK